MQKFNMKKSIQKLLKSLKDKEREVLEHRFGLFGNEAKTLASIGKTLGLTRERIRQIQNSGLKKIKNSNNHREDEVFSHLRTVTKDRGGVIHVNDVVKSVSGKHNDVVFILESSIDLNKVKGQKSLTSVYIHKDLDNKKLIDAEKEIESILKKTKKALNFENIYKKYCQEISDCLDSLAVESLLEASNSFSKDWEGRYGLSEWREVNPKSARDKAYFVMKKIDKPIHFTHIADLIEKENFRGKNPTAATVHNELILDERFVLVGRGIYALKEWGFTGGTVEEVIEEVLRENPEGLEREDLIEKVLKKKLVAKNTVVMNLLVKNKFKKNKKGNYKLVK